MVHLDRAADLSVPVCPKSSLELLPSSSLPSPNDSRLHRISG